jgi:hypothetical protein
MTFALGDRLFKRGTSALRPSATPQDALTAVRYDWTMVEVESGIDLFAFEKLIPTLTDWFVTCHPSVPAVYYGQHIASTHIALRTERPGVSMPAVTTRFVRTKHDMRNGSRTGSPVSSVPSATCSHYAIALVVVPGWIVESMIFFAFHNSGVICCIFPVLYAVTSVFAFSRPAEDVNSVLCCAWSAACSQVNRAHVGKAKSNKKRPEVVVLTTPRNRNGLYVAQCLTSGLICWQSAARDPSKCQG